MQVKRNNLSVYSEENAAPSHAVIFLQFTFLNVIYHPIKSNKCISVVPSLCTVVVELSSSRQEFSNSGGLCGQGSKDFWNLGYKEKTYLKK